MVIPNRVNKFEITVNDKGGINASHIEEDFVMYFPDTVLFNAWVVQQMPLENNNRYLQLKDDLSNKINNIYKELGK